MERQSVRTKKVKTEEMNVAHSCAKGNGTLGTKALGQSTGHICGGRVIRRSWTVHQHATSSQHSLDARGAFS